MQSTVVVMPLDPYGPLRHCTNAFCRAACRFEQPRFTFTPHVTLSFYPELSREALRELTGFRVKEPITIDRIQAYRALDLTRSIRVVDLPLGPAT